jgi:hypothetical protein
MSTMGPSYRNIEGSADPTAREQLASPPTLREGGDTTTTVRSEGPDVKARPAPRSLLQSVATS